jgi:cell division protein FtsB
MRFVKICLIILVALLVLLAGLYQVVQGFWRWQEAREVKQQYDDKIAELEDRRDQLKEYVEKLKTHPLTKERIARRIGYIKRGETIYKIERSPPRPTDRDAP